MGNDRSPEKNNDDTDTESGVRRRDLLLSGAALVAATALGSGISNSAQAQPAPPSLTPPSGTKPNILFIMGDDIGWFNVSAYNMGIMGYPTSTASAERAQFSPTGMASRAVPRVVRHSSRANRRSARD
jgi:hypothetical protein